MESKLTQHQAVSVLKGLEKPWEYLERLLEFEALDLHVEFSVASETMWDCKLTVVNKQSNGRPDHGKVVYAVAGTSAEDALKQALMELAVWPGVET